jgi:hypothetical protein
MRGVTEIVQTCVNHPDTETRLSCSACGDPICTRCVRTAAVGQKCPDCARTPRSARALGKPEHYVRAVGVGLLAALAGGVVYAQLLVVLRIGSLILAGVLGFGLGRIVRWGTRGQSQQPFLGIAMGLAVVAVAVAFLARFGTLLPAAGLVVVAYPVAVWLAVRGLRG